MKNCFDVTGKENCYACPICLTEFEIIISKIPVGLTREHVPPHSLGGIVQCYTCKKCNNDFGSEADKQLLIGIQQNQKTFLKTLNGQKVRIKTSEGVFQGQMSGTADGAYTITHSKKNNHVVKLEKFIGKIERGSLLGLEYLVPSFDSQLFNVGLLKSAYLQAFSDLGYEIVIGSQYHMIREQLKRPNERLYYERTVLYNTFEPHQRGVYKVNLDIYSFICCILVLKYANQEHTFGIMLPDSNTPFIDVLSFISTIHVYMPKENAMSIDEISRRTFSERISGVFSPIEPVF